jgi:hypothetical protein
MLTFVSRAVERVNTVVIHLDHLPKLLDSNGGRKVANLTEIFCNYSVMQTINVP